MRNVPLRLVHVIAPVVAPEGWSDIEAAADYAQLREDQARRIIEQAQGRP